MADFTFWFIAILTVASAIMVVMSKSLLYSAYSLLVTFLGVTALYVFLWADFLAVVQVVVYVGGIRAIVILGFIGVLGFMIYNTPWIQLANSEPADTTRSIGNLLMIDYLLPFEAASFLLLGALIGATTLSRKDD